MTDSARSAKYGFSPVIRLALPAPRIDLDEHMRQINALRRDPKLLFQADMRVVLQHEVDYYRPQAQWARSLLKLLDRFERRQRHRNPHVETHSQAIMDKHLAWQQAQQGKMDTAASAN
jgi:hypothetical protein